MNVKILLGIFVVFGLFGVSFAWHGFEGSAVPGEALETIKEKMEICREYFESEEISSLQEELQEAVESEDFEKAEKLRGQIMGDAPEGCRPRMPRRAGALKSLPDEVKEELKQAFEDRDPEILKEIKEEHFPEGYPVGPGRIRHMECNCWEATE